MDKRLVLRFLCVDYTDLTFNVSKAGLGLGGAGGSGDPIRREGWRTSAPGSHSFEVLI